MIGAIAAAAIPSIISGVGNWLGGNQANEANAAEAQKNRDFQERMSNTSYQRAAADVAAAGGNPAFALSHGGASTPSGATAAPMQNTTGNALNSATAVAEAVARVQNTKAQTAATEAQTNQLNLESVARLAEITARANAMSHSDARAEKLFRWDDMAAKGRAEQERAGGIRANYLLPYAEEEQKLLLDEIRQAIRTSATSAAEASSRTAMNRLELPGMRNRAESENTWFGRYIRPYENDARTASQILSDIRSRVNIHTERNFNVNQPRRP